MIAFSRILSKVHSLRNDFLFANNFSYANILGSKKNFILMYHGVCNTANNPFNSRHCYVSDFENQIKYLSKNANIISLKDFFDGKFDASKCNIAITFDDGYRNNLTLAAPILDKYKVKASMYITGLHTTDEPIIWADFYQIASYYTTKNIFLNNEEYTKSGNAYFRIRDKKNLLEIIKHEQPEYSFKVELYQQLKEEFNAVKNSRSELWELMNEKEIQELSNYKSITIGSHGFLHNNLGNIKSVNAKEELQQSKKYLENLLQQSVDEIAYPDGSYSNDVVTYAQALGFDYQLAADNFIRESDQEFLYLKKRHGVYQCASWGNQIVF